MNLLSGFIQNSSYLIFMKEYVSVMYLAYTFGIYLERDYRLGLSMGVPGDDAVGAGEVELDLRDL